MSSGFASAFVGSGGGGGPQFRGNLQNHSGRGGDGNKFHGPNRGGSSNNNNKSRRDGSPKRGGGERQGRGNGDTATRGRSGGGGRDAASQRQGGRHQQQQQQQSASSLSSGRGRARGRGAGGGDRSRGGASEAPTAMQLARPPVFRGILDGTANRGNQRPLPRSMQPQGQSQTHNSVLGSHTPSASAFGNTTPMHASPSGRPPPPSYTPSAAQEGVLGGSASRSDVSPSAMFGHSSPFQPQLSAITPDSQPSLLSVPSPSTPATFRASVIGGSAVTSGVLGSAPLSTPVEEASGITATPQRASAQAELTGMPPPAPRSALKSPFVTAAAEAASPIATPAQSTLASSPGFGVFGRRPDATGTSPAAAAGSDGGSAFAMRPAGSSVFTAPPSSDVRAKRGRTDEDDAEARGVPPQTWPRLDAGQPTPSPPSTSPASGSAFSAALKQPSSGQKSSVNTPARGSSSIGLGAGSDVALSSHRPANTQLPSTADITTGSVPRLDSVRLATPQATSASSYCYAARLFSLCATQLLSESETEQESAGAILGRIFFDPVIGRLGVHANFEETAREMLAAWKQAQTADNNGRKNKGAGSRKEEPEAAWVAAAAIGAQLNMICTTLARARTTDASSSSTPAASGVDAALESYTRVVAAHPEATMLDACKQANRLAHLIKYFFTNQKDAHTPFSVLSPLIRRVRATFEEAQLYSEGTLAIASDLPSALRTTFRTLNVRVRELIQGDTLDVYSTLKKSIIMAFAHLVLEMMAAGISNSEDVMRFMQAFHATCRDAAEERFTMYYRVAGSYLTSAFAITGHVEEVAKLLAHALTLCPDETPVDTRRRLFGQLAAAKLACGDVPQPEDLRQNEMPQLLDVVAAVRASSLQLLDVAIRRNAPYFVELGVHNLLEMARERVALLLVIKFYQLQQGAHQLKVDDMVRYCDLPFRSSVEANMCWLLPLLMKKRINGVLDGGMLILSQKNPFPEYAKDLVLAANGNEDLG